MTQPLLVAALFGVAVLYASVGHGGASGYQAVMGLAGQDLKEAATGSLVLNLLVAGTAWIGFARAGHFSWRLLWPFLVGSVPAAILGARLPVPARALSGLLAFVLVVAAVAMLLPRKDEEVPDRRPPLAIAGIAGALIGTLSGIVGVGGGIFLSPLMIACRWATVRRTAATSAAFIVINSAAGLAGRGAAIPASIWPLVGVTFLGGLLGAWLGSKKLPLGWLRAMLAIVLVVAAGKLAMKAAA
jgi:hypothetical protein